MEFGQKTVYLYGEIYKDKFSTPEKGYPISPLKLSCSECPAKLVNDKIEIFFPGAIFNTYVVSLEEKVSVLKSWDNKLTIARDRLEKNRLYTVKIIEEDDKKRVVEIYKFNELFPGQKTTGTMYLDSTVPTIKTPIGEGELILQNNEQKGKVECILYKIEDTRLTFVEINNPVERTTVRVVKDMDELKIVENRYIKGIIMNSRSKKEEINVYTKRACLGKYIFIEDIEEGEGNVELLGKCKDGYKVKYKGFTGVCKDKKVSKTMRGQIKNIKGSSFLFERSNDKVDGMDNTKNVANKADDMNNVTNKTDDMNNVANDSNNAANNIANNTKRAKTNEPCDEFVKVTVKGMPEIKDEKDIEGNEFRAVEFIKREAESGKNVLPLVNKYLGTLKSKDYLCLYYLQLLEKMGELDIQQVSRMLKTGSDKLPKMMSEYFDDTKILEYIFKKKKTKSGYKKLLEASSDKVSFMKENQMFLPHSIDYVYRKMKTPRPVVESIIGNQWAGWQVYLKHEKGDYKRGLFRRLAGMKFRKEEMKEIFQKWLEYEEENHGNVEEVKTKAKEYVGKEAL